MAHILEVIKQLISLEKWYNSFYVTLKKYHPYRILFVLFQTNQKEQEDPVVSLEKIDLQNEAIFSPSKGRNVKILSSNLPDVSTGDVPSLDKPFQCDKCESD